MSPASSTQPDAQAAADRLLPRQRSPYYVVAPNYIRASAGIKALHMLCHALNRAGETAYMVIHPFYPRPDRATHPYLLTPLLDAARLQQHYDDGVCPITVYPETVHGNPFGAPLVARYLLNFPGLLGGTTSFPPEEICVAYSERIADAVPDVASTLFLPASDPALFTLEPRQARAGTCFYAAKYQEVHHGQLFEITRDSVEITRLRPDSQTPEAIASLFRSSELFYCYENSALIIEALLCGCPVVMLPNPYLDQSIGEAEIGRDGIAWGADPAEIARARATVEQGRANYLACFPRFEAQLRRFIAVTQARAAVSTYARMLEVPHLRHPGRLARLVATWELTRAMLRARGTVATLLSISSRLRRKGFTLP